MRGQNEIAEWRVFSTAGQIHEHLGHGDEASASWGRSAGVIKRLLDSLGVADQLRQSLVTSQRLPREIRRLLPEQQSEKIVPVPPIKALRATQGRPAAQESETFD